jgi:hypothetical protein
MPNQPNSGDPGKNKSPVKTFFVRVLAAIGFTALAVAFRAYQSFTNWEHMRTLDGYSGVVPLVTNAIIWGLIPGLLFAGVVILLTYGGSYVGSFLGQINSKFRLVAQTRQGRIAQPNDPPLPTLPPNPTWQDVFLVLLITVSFWSIWYGMQVFVHFATFYKMHTLDELGTAAVDTLHGMVWSVPIGLIVWGMAILARWVPPAALSWLGPILDVILAGARAVASVTRATRRAIMGNAEIRIDDPEVDLWLRSWPERMRTGILLTALRSYMATHKFDPKEGD